GHGRIWAGSANGLFQLDRAGDDWTFREVTLPGFKEQANEINVLITDASGDLLVASNRGVYRISTTGGQTRLSEQPTESIFRDRDNRLWIDVGGELRVMTCDRDALTLVHSYTQRDGLPANALHFHVIQLTDGHIYIGFEYGISEFLPAAKA